MSTVAKTFDTKQPGHRLPDGCRMAAGWLPDGCPVAAQWLPGGCRVARGLQVPVWGRCLAGWGAGSFLKTSKNPTPSRASFCLGNFLFLVISVYIYQAPEHLQEKSAEHNETDTFWNFRLNLANFRRI